MEAYLANVELMAARAGKQHMLKDVDIVSKIVIIVVNKLVCSGLIKGVYC